jgi:hypothetical protein
MKKTTIIILALFAFFSARAQVNYIISTLFEPDSCTLIQAYDTSKWDLNHDGENDIFFRSVPHQMGAGNDYYMFFAPNWSFYVKPPAVYDTVLVEPMVIDEGLQWLPWEHQVLSSFTYPPFYAFRHEAEDGIHYGWMYVHEEYYNLNCIRGMGYCTLPDTPILWGQTELLGVGENEHETIGKLHPNPTTGLIAIEGEKATEVQVFNPLGQLVKTFQNTNKISLEGLPQGVYLLRVTTEDGKVFSEKVVKN